MLSNYTKTNNQITITKHTYQHLKHLKHNNPEVHNHLIYIIGK